MDYIVSVTKLDGFEQLVDICPHHVQLNTVWVFLENLEQVLLQVFKYQVKSVHPVVKRKQEVIKVRNSME